MNRSCGQCGESGHNRKTCEKPWRRKAVPEAIRNFESEVTRTMEIEDDAADPDVEEYMNTLMQKEIYLREVDRYDRLIKEMVTHRDRVWIKIAKLTMESRK